MSELLVLNGSTDGTNTTGTISFTSDLIYNPVQNIVIPKGVKAKIWVREVNGDTPTTFDIQYTDDVTVITPTWKTIDSITMPSSGIISIDSRRPIIARGRDGKQAIRVTWSQSTAGSASIVLVVEIEEM